ncbi:CHAP domain-containing protein, partial [Streptococcus agalactiae]|nr:CHAP domain-containing protein [Streptococcus agalactiae]MCK6294270.1 CHAP domain-containing protein [Streptococcus agalactiae]
MKGIQAEAGVDAYIIEGEAKAGFKVFGLNIDARAIIAIAIAESSLGTQGVATAPGANMFGFGAFDNNTTNAQNFSDDKAVIKMTQETIIQNQNTSFAIQDQKAQLLSTG